MAKKLKTVDQLPSNEDEQLKKLIEFLRTKGYGVFKIEEYYSSTQEAERVAELKELGYGIEHYRDRLVKIDTSKISSADDVVLYFYERMRRAGLPLMEPKVLKDSKARRIDCSVINTLVQWRMSEGNLSFKAALEDVFMMIDILVEKAEEWGIEIKSAAILSINQNKSLVLRLLREVKLKQDRQLNYDIDNLIADMEIKDYITVLRNSKKMMEGQKGVSNKTSRRKVSV